MPKLSTHNLPRNHHPSMTHPPTSPAIACAHHPFPNITPTNARSAKPQQPPAAEQRKQSTWCHGAVSDMATEQQMMNSIRHLSLFFLVKHGNGKHVLSNFVPAETQNNNPMCNNNPTNAKDHPHMKPITHAQKRLPTFTNDCPHMKMSAHEQE